MFLVGISVTVQRKGMRYKGDAKEGLRYCRGINRKRMIEA